jgi:isonocardicin synthase
MQVDNFYSESVGIKLQTNSQTLERFVVALDAKPYDIFFIKKNEHLYFGVKVEVNFPNEWSAEKRKCALVEPHMLYGEVSTFFVGEDGYSIFYYSQSNENKAKIFQNIEIDNSAYLYYPFGKISDSKEVFLDNDDWEPTLELASELDDDEIPLRAIANRRIKELGLKSGLFFDPACSTGTFLGSMKKFIPDIYAVGQDMNKGMIQLAKSKLDEVHCGDSINPIVKDLSVDFLILRFLNACVMSSVMAEKIFKKLSKSLKPGGICMVFGHTPVLLPPDFFSYHGFDIISSIEKVPDRNAFCEFYTLRKL